MSYKKATLTVQVVAPEGTPGLLEAVTHALDNPGHYPDSADTSDWSVTVTPGGLAPKPEALYVLENEHGQAIGLFTSMQSLAAAVAELPGSERMTGIASYPADELSPGQRLDLDELPAVPGAWWLDEQEETS